MFYDPMIAKLITWAPTREAAIDAQIDALDAFEIDGISDNVDFLSALMQHPRFRAGDLDDRLHRRGISRRLRRRAGRRAADRRPRRARRRWSARSRDARAAMIDGQLGDAGFPQPTRARGPDRQATTSGARSSPMTAARSRSSMTATLIDVVGDWAPGQRLLVGRHRRAPAHRPGARARAAAGSCTTRGARAQGAGACPAMSPSCRST